MRLKKMMYLFLVLSICFVIHSGTVFGQDLSEDTEKKEQIINEQLKFFNWDEIDKLEGGLNTSAPALKSFSLKDEVISIIKGEKRFSLDALLMLVGQMLFGEIGVFIKLGARFILIVLLCNMLEILSSSFQSKNTTKVSFFVCYMVVLYSVIQSFFMLIKLARDAIDQMSQIIFASLPSLLAFMTTSGYVSSSAALAPVIISALNISTYIIKNLLLPCIISVIVLEIITTISDEFKVDKFVQLFYRGIKWILKGILVACVSILGFYKMTLPYVDMTVKKAAVNISAAFIPVIGDAANEAVDFIVNCSFLVKNAFSAGVIIWIIIIVSLPLIKILSYVIVYYVAAAVIEPIGDKKMANIATKLAKGCEFIMSCVGMVALLCVIVLLICMSVGGNIV